MDFLQLYPNKSVKIIKTPFNYTILCRKREITPGAYSIVDVEKRTWYTIEICCTKFGFGNPGLWIADINKNTLFYGNYFTNYGRGYLKRSFFTGDHNKVLVGILVKNATDKSGFVLERLVVNKTNIEDEKKNIKETTPSEFKNTLLYTNFFNNSNNSIDNNSDNNYNSSKTITQNTTQNNIVDEKVDNKLESNFSPNDYSNLVQESGEQIQQLLEQLTSSIVVPKDTANNILDQKSIEEIENYDITPIYTVDEKYDDISIKIDILSYPVKTFQVYPISLGIPKEYILDDIPVKNTDFFKYEIGESILKKYKDRDSFYTDLSKSHFILISKHYFGNDEPIYYEALAQGCIPIFMEELHEYTSPFLPKELLNRIKNEDGVNLGWVNSNKISYSDINKLAKNLLDYTRDYLSTESIANYVINVTENNVRNVLFLANADKPGDFLLQQSLIHGLKNKLGNTNVVDYPKLSNMYNNINCEPKYRMGLPYDNTLNESNVSRGRLRKRIENKEFDLIIIMGIFSEEDRLRLKIDKGDFPFKDVINEHYVKNEIFFIDGTNNNSIDDIYNKLKNYSENGICFCKDFV